MAYTSLLHDEDVKKDVEKYLYDSIMKSNSNSSIKKNQNRTNKIGDDDIIVVKKSFGMKVMISIAIVVVMVSVVTYYSNITSFPDNNNNNPSSTASVAMVGTRSRQGGVPGCNIASDTYIDAVGRTVDNKKPFQLCFQFGNTDSFCWSKSRSHKEFLFGGISWVGCYPCGYNIDSEYQFDDYWHGTSGQGDNNCGPTCTEFCHPKDINKCNTIPCVV